MNKDFDKTLFLEHDTYLSFKDLEKIDNWREVLVSGDTKALESILHTNGCDLSFGYEILSCEHATRTKPHVRHFGPKVTFRERRDKEFEPYRAVEDICRTHESSVVRYGMRESLNMGVNLNDIIEEQLSTHARLLEMKQLDKGKK